jgi:hypothetical protein
MTFVLVLIVALMVWQCVAVAPSWLAVIVTSSTSCRRMRLVPASPAPVR